MAKKSSSSNDDRPIRELLRRLIQAPAMLSIISPVLLLFVGYFSWQRWGAEHLARQYYLDINAIKVTSPPESIKNKVQDLVHDVYEDTAMDQLSLLDPRAAEKIAAAFSMNSWVQNVITVRKLPGGGIDIHLVYREPAAMIYAQCGSLLNNGEPGFFAVDGEGYLLKYTDFTPRETSRYTQVEIPGFCADHGNAGTKFGDFRVEAAAKLAKFILPIRDELNVRMIGIYGNPRDYEPPQLELLTGTEEQLIRFHQGHRNALQRFHWGSVPGQELPGEATAMMKVQKLQQGIASGSDLRIARMP